MNSKFFIIIASILLLLIMPIGTVSANTFGGGDSGGGGAGRCWAVNQPRVSVSGSKIVLPGGTSTYGYCHIAEAHMAYPTTSLNLAPNGKTQFSKGYSEINLMDQIIMDVINNQSELIYLNSNKTKAKKEMYSSVDKKKIRVVLNVGYNFNADPTLQGYTWIVTSAYPIP